MYKLSNIAQGITVINTNSIKDTVITAIMMIPVIPGGVAMLFRYLKKVDIKINWTWIRLYNKKRHEKLHSDIFKYKTGGCELI